MDSKATTRSGSPAPQEELAELCAALQAHVRRRAARGFRSAPAAARFPDAAHIVPAPPVPPVERPASPSSRGPSPDLFGASRSPGYGSARRRQGSASPALAAAEIKARENREKAAACSTLEELSAAVAQCTACALCKTRTQTVFSDGDGRARVMFVGEAPGQSEDEQGVPFVGRAGQLLTDIITRGMGLERSAVYIGNVLKCRPPDNRDPTDAEKVMCTPWLDRQIELADPEVIVPLGRHAANHVLGTELSIGALRGRTYELGKRKVVPTFHPSYLLRSPGEKKECWKDIQVAMGILGLSPPPRQPGLHRGGREAGDPPR